MKEYNDYVETTRRYLRSYAQLQITVKNLDEDIEASSAWITSIAKAITSTRKNERD